MLFYLACVVSRLHSALFNALSYWIKQSIIGHNCVSRNKAYMLTLILSFVLLGDETEGPSILGKNAILFSLCGRARPWIFSLWPKKIPAARSLLRRLHQRGTQRPNISKYARSVSGSFPWALEACLVKLC